MKESKRIKKLFFCKPKFRSNLFNTLFLFVQRITRKSTIYQKEIVDDVHITPIVLNEVQQQKEFIFSKRQQDIIVLVKQGKTNKEIGQSLFISENTVKYHLKIIYNILKIGNRIELACIKL